MMQQQQGWKLCTELKEYWSGKPEMCSKSPSRLLFKSTALRRPRVAKKVVKK